MANTVTDRAAAKNPVARNSIRGIRGGGKSPPTGGTPCAADRIEEPDKPMMQANMNYWSSNMELLDDAYRAVSLGVSLDLLVQQRLEAASQAQGEDLPPGPGSDSPA